MFENFEKIKKQLSELAEVVNSFKSESVQLKIIELIFGYVPEAEEEATEVNKPDRKKRTRHQKAAPKSAEPLKSAPQKKTSGGTGAVATLIKLLEGDFFKQPRTINDIIEHCKHKKALHFKANEFSGRLARLIRDGKINRTKNKDNQYEYKKP